MKPIEIAEQYETTHFDDDASLGQSETKDGVDIDWVVALGSKLPRDGGSRVEALYVSPSCWFLEHASL